MRYFLTLLIALGMSQAHSADWTPVFGNLLTPQSQKLLLGNQKPINNFYPKIGDMVMDGNNWVENGYRLTNAAKSGNYTGIPRPYRGDMQPATITKIDDCTYEAVVPLKNASLFGKPITQLVYSQYVCEMLPRTDYIEFGSMNDASFNQLKKQVKFKQIKVTPQESDCSSQKTRPAAELTKEDNKMILGFDTLDMDCG